MSRKPSKNDSIAFKLPRLRVPAWLWMGALIVVIGGVGGLFAASKMEENDAFCASCHSQPESTYYDRSTATAPVDLASFHRGQETRCIDCHSGAGVSGRLTGISTGTIDLMFFLSGTAKQPAPLRYPIADQNCTKCHTDTTSTQDFKRHFHAFLPQWQQMDAKAATCVSCHTTHTIDSTDALGYLNEQTVVGTCNNCHKVAGVEGN
jgi:hypothetical protein